MARFDVYRVPQRPGYLLDCQADILRDLATRFVVPLVQDARVPRANKLNPIFTIADEMVVMATQLASAVDARKLGKPVASLAGEQSAIMHALDMLVTGY